MEAGDQDIRSILERNWPEGIPPEEEALIEALPAKRVALVAQRLRAILDAEAGEPIGECAARLGMDRAAFYRLRRRWAELGSLRALAPFAGRAPRRLGPSRSLLDQRMMEEVLRSLPPTASVRELANELMRRSQASLSYDAAARLARAERMRLAAHPDLLADRFGRAILADVCAVSLAASRSSDIIPVVVAVVVDRASRLIVGHAAGQADEGLLKQIEAAGSTGWMLRARERVDVPQPDLEVVIGHGGAADVEHIRERASAAGAAVFSSGERRYGIRFLSLVGHRLGRLRLRPRATSPSSASVASVSDLSFPPMEIGRAVALVDEAVRDHNYARLVELAGEDGRSPALRHAVRDYLTEVARLTGRSDGIDALAKGCAVLRDFLRAGA